MNRLKLPENLEEKLLNQKESWYMLNKGQEQMDKIYKKDGFPKVYIIILNYNGWMDTIECLD